MNNIGSKIRKVRELKGFTQEYMANKLNISQRAYSKTERGETKIDNDKMKKIAVILEIDPMDMQLFDESYIFNNCDHWNTSNHFINQMPSRLIEQYEVRIKQLEKENEFLRVMCMERS